MKNIKLSSVKILYFLFTFILISSCEKEEIKINITPKEEIANYLNHIIKRHEIPGVSLAILKNDSIIFKQNFGKANIEHNVSIKNESVFRIYSLTKLSVSIAVFQLIEQKKLSLEDEVGKYITDIPVSWQKVQLKHLLTHSSGLPDMAAFPEREKLTEEDVKGNIFKKEIEFIKGEKFAYNQSNFWLLQRIIEKVSGENLESFILKNQFGKENKEVFFSSNSKEIIKDRVTPYFPFETGRRQINHSVIPGRYMLAANGLNITMDEFIKWNNRLSNNELLSKEFRGKMWEVFPYLKSNKKFTYGWDKRIINNHNSYGFSGSLVTAYRIFPEENLSIIFLSNGLGNYFNIENIVNHIASLIDEKIVDINNLVFEKSLQSIVNGDIESFKKEILIIKNDKKFKEVNLENIVNDVGYLLINHNKMDKSIEVFTFNTKENPTSANTFDSLGEVYFLSKEYDLSIINYEKAIALGGTNGNAKRMLEKINKIKKK